MSGTANLTRDEAAARAAVLDVTRTVVHLDLSHDDGSVDIRTFRARSTIHIVLREEGSTFLDLDAESVEHVSVDGVECATDGFTGTRVLLADLTAGMHVIEVGSTMRYSRDGRGLHRFVDPTDGVVYLHSQFEPFHALQVFACFDQPDLKTVFELSVDAPAGWVVVSNEPTLSAPEEGSAGRWEFARTPRISTYLTAIIGGGYVSTASSFDRPDGSSVPLRLFVRRSLAEHLEADELFAVTRAGLEYFERVFDRYPFSKYDQLFVPEFSAGAMENPGCVTFTEAYVFRSRVTDMVRERRAETVLHEMAHMWFGDLVTMRWWDDLWLNESFATFMSVLAMVEGTRWQDAWVTFLDAEKTWAKLQDQLPSTHPIADEMPDVESVHQNFDGITYAKGASVLRQLVAWVGQEEFLAGCRDYFAQHAWGNTTLSDFLGALERSSGRELSAWRDEWLRTTGVNLLTPEIEVAEDGTYGSVRIAQSDPAPLWRPEGHAPILRRHRLAVGVYDLDGNRLVRRERVELDVQGAMTQVEGLTGVRAGDLLLLNDDDLTFARIALDERSLTTATAHLSGFVDPMPRAMVWSAAWDMLRDALLPASSFVALVVHNLAHDEQVGVLQRLLMRATAAAERYAASQHRDRLRAALRDQARAALSRCEAGGDHQLAWFRHWASLASQPENLTLLSELLDGVEHFPGLSVDTDLRWAIVVALAHAGRADDALIDDELARDDTDLGQRQAMTARASRPEVTAKTWARSLLRDDADLSHTLARQLWAGFGPLDQVDLAVRYLSDFPADLDHVWETRTLDFAIEFAAGMFPHAAVDAGLIEMTDEILARTDLSKPLRRVILEQRDTVVRTSRARAVDGATATAG
ncbi:MAG: aminopeptidase N [Actinomycetota bacterium]|nr:aminopeptidase N [Actinomycetota bacterium]